MKTYFYLARRNKQGIKVLATLSNKNSIAAVRITDATKLGLPSDLETKIQAQMYENRMLWELWAESANNFTDLKTNLKNRGYKDLPLSANPIYEPEVDSVINKLQKKSDLTIKSDSIKSMLRKSSSF